MQRDDPLERIDPDRTIAMPRPGGHAAPAPIPPIAADPPTFAIRPERDGATSGFSPLVAAANPLLNLVPRLRATAVHRDPPTLRRELARGIRDFEARAGESGISERKIIAARYLLCTFLDEVIAGMPWGAALAAPDSTLLHEFHSETRGGEKAFGLLARLSDDPAANLDLLQLFHACLALGFEGRYAGTPDGRAQLAAITERLIELTAPARGTAGSGALSFRWAGAAVERHPVLAVLPLWVVFLAGGALALAGYLVLNARLNSESDAVFRRVHAIAADARLERKPIPAAAPRLAAQLQSDASAGSLTVQDLAQSSIVTLPADRLFAGGGAQLDERYAAMLARVAQAVATTAGSILVTGHTDGTPSNSLQYPSNWHLSREQARAVAGALVRSGVAFDRIRAEGRADAEPVAAGTSADERARNRRVEIVLQLPRPEAATQ